MYFREDQVSRLRRTFLRDFAVGNMIAFAISAACTALLVGGVRAEAQGQQALIRISCGGGGAAGEFAADTLASDEQTYAVTEPITRSAADAAPESVYQHERYGIDVMYSIAASAPPAGKSYTVRLHFAELYDDGAGKRIQEVIINGKVVLPNLDVFAEAGGKDKALIKEFGGIVPGPDRTIEIEFAAIPGHDDANAAINGIEVLGNGFVPTAVPVHIKHYLFQDSSLPTAARVEDLVSHLTLREKVGQMRYTAPGITRLGIPSYNWWNEALHGVARAGVATVFPQAIGLAGTWDTALHFQVATAISDEARAKYNDAIAHNNHAIYYGLDFWSPNINIFRDPRWGRGQETYGEDPYLTGRFGVAFIQGMQGSDPKYLKVVATAKHFAVHSGPEALRHVFDAQPSAYDLNDTYLPAFEAAVKEGHVRSVMGAYNSVDGVPACASPLLLQQTLRDKWGFDGYVVSDCGAISDIAYNHHYAKDAAEASADAVKAGCDLACDDAYGALMDAVNRKLIGEVELDRAVKRLFTARFQLGMFDPPAMVHYASIPLSVNDSPAHRALAGKVARESLVLLKNEHEVLPLSKSVRSVAVIGPNGNDPGVLLGNYNGDTSHGVTILEGIQNKLGVSATVSYAQGCDIKGGSKDGFAAALALAQKSDVVVAALGMNQSAEGEEGDGGDRTNLNLPGVQEDLLEALAATGKPIVLVLLNGSALAINWADAHIPAILEAWYPGEEGGAAIADTLFGDFNPSGRLPLTFYRSANDLPTFTDYAMKNRTYRYFGGNPLYPFGYGLSYTKFKYTQLSIPATVQAARSVSVQATVTNTGLRAGDEVVQLYLRPAPGTPLREVYPGQPMPRLCLAGFQRVQLAVGQSKTVKFSISPQQWLLVNKQGVRALQPGSWQVYVGGMQPSPLLATQAGFLSQRISVGPIKKGN